LDGEPDEAESGDTFIESVEAVSGVPATPAAH